MVTPDEVHGKRLALVVWGKKHDGSDDVVVFSGIANWDGVHLTMLRRSEPAFHLSDKWLARLVSVKQGLRAMLLDAEYSISVTIGDLPEGASAEEYLKTGLVWPKDDAST